MKNEEQGWQVDDTGWVESGVGDDKGAVVVRDLAGLQHPAGEVVKARLKDAAVFRDYAGQLHPSVLEGIHDDDDSSTLERALERAYERRRAGCIPHADVEAAFMRYFLALTAEKDAALPECSSLGEAA